SGCATMSRTASMAITFRRAGRFRSRSSAPKLPSDMYAPPSPQPSDSYFIQLSRLTLGSIEQLAGPPAHPDRASAAARRLAGQVWRLSASGAVLVVILMIGFDATEIGLMPSRGTQSLWPLRILTDFGRDAYVISVLTVMLLAIAVVL